MFPDETQILVIDDSANIRQVIASTLEKIGFYKVETAADANIALEKLNKRKAIGKPFELILSDLNMPGPSGIDFLQQVRAMPDCGNMPFIIITTESEKGAVLEAALHGVSSYVVKPFDYETIKKKLQEAWTKHGAKYLKFKN